MMRVADAFSARNLSTERSRRCQRILHLLKCHLVDKRAYKHILIPERIADPDRRINLLQLAYEGIINGAVYE